jgi:NTP pyrophosphatase (non-canonical NTP hydrolase)
MFDMANMYALMDENDRISREHGWTAQVPDDRPEVFSEKMLLVVSEITEALEAWRDGHALTEVWEATDSTAKRETGCPDPSCDKTYPHLHPETVAVPKPEGIPIELADAVIRIMDFCVANNIDLVHAINRKMEYNKTRTWRHGGKRA